MRYTTGLMEWGTRRGRTIMGEHEKPPPQPDPSKNGSNPNPERPIPPREPGKHEKK